MPPRARRKPRLIISTMQDRRPLQEHQLRRRLQACGPTYSSSVPGSLHDSGGNLQSTTQLDAEAEQLAIRRWDTLQATELENYRGGWVCGCGKPWTSRVQSLPTACPWRPVVPSAVAAYVQGFGSSLRLNLVGLTAADSPSLRLVDSDQRLTYWPRPESSHVH